MSTPKPRYNIKLETNVEKISTKQKSSYLVFTVLLLFIEWIYTPSPGSTTREYTHYQHVATTWRQAQCYHSGKKKKIKSLFINKIHLSKLKKGITYLLLFIYFRLTLICLFLLEWKHCSDDCQTSGLHLCSGHT